MRKLWLSPQVPVQSGLFYLIYRQRYLRRWSPEIFAGRVVTLAALPAGNADETENEGKEPITKLNNSLILLELILHYVDSVRVDGIKFTSTLFSKIRGWRSTLHWCFLSTFVDLTKNTFSQPATITFFQICPKCSSLPLTILQSGYRSAVFPPKYRW